MITLRKRLSVNNRVGSIKIFDISKITDDEVNYLISKLGKDIYQQIYQICNSLNYYWLGFDDQTSDYSIYPSYEDVMKEYNPVIAEQLNITLPEDYVAIEMEE